MIESVQLKYNDLLVIDPCYIKSVKDDSGELRFDALKCVKTLHEGDDGSYVISAGDTVELLGVDSGRIWVLRAEFDCTAELDAGFSRYLQFHFAKNINPQHTIDMLKKGTTWD